MVGEGHLMGAKDCMISHVSFFNKKRSPGHIPPDSPRSLKAEDTGYQAPFETPIYLQIQNASFYVINVYWTVKREKTMYQ